MNENSLYQLTLSGWQVEFILAALNNSAGLVNLLNNVRLTEQQLDYILQAKLVNLSEKIREKLLNATEVQDGTLEN